MAISPKLIPTLSVKNLWGFFIVYGVKDVENRTWTTRHRGKMLIHASGQSQDWPDAGALPSSLRAELEAHAESGTNRNDLPEMLRRYDIMCEDCETFLQLPEDCQSMTAAQWNSSVNNAVKKYGYPMQSQSIIGHVDLVDVVRDSDSPWAMPNHYHWVLANPVAYHDPIMGVPGKLGLWNFNLPYPMIPITV